MKSGMSDHINDCINDIRTTVETGKWGIDAQVRIYDLLSLLMDDIYHKEISAIQAKEFLMIYTESKDKLDAAFDAKYLNDRVKARLAPLERACSDARFEAAAAASLHEFAKETFEIWQNSGVFRRRRALNALRERAGFELESNRIGNYVAKTFDLMNEAQVRFAAAQQRVFSNDVTFKIKPGLHSRVAEILKQI